MSIVHPKVKPVSQIVRAQVCHVYRKPELKPVDQTVGDQVLYVYRTPETETSRSQCRRPGTSCLLYTGN
jgi:hypothetical protein